MNGSGNIRKVTNFGDHVVRFSTLREQKNWGSWFSSDLGIKVLNHLISGRSYTSWFLGLFSVPMTLTLFTPNYPLLPHVVKIRIITSLRYRFSVASGILMTALYLWWIPWIYNQLHQRSSQVISITAPQNQLFNASLNYVFFVIC